MSITYLEIDGFMKKFDVKRIVFVGNSKFRVKLSPTYLD